MTPFFSTIPKKIVSELGCVLLILTGLAGNYCHFDIVNAHFIFGSIFAMLALQIFGLWRGVIAAAVISSYTYFLWNHPYAIITMTAEAAAVGWLFSRKKISMPAADAVYWICFGIPIGYVCFLTFGELSSSASLFLLTKQAINGIANALIARLIFTLYLIFSRSKMISFREIITNLLAFFVLCTALIMLTVSSRSDLKNTDNRIRESLARNSRRVTDSFENWLNDRRNYIVHLAEMAANMPTNDLQRYMDHLRISDANFLRIAVMDKDATITAYSPPVDELGRSNIGKNFSDRPYLPILKQKLSPMLSEIMDSRFGRKEPVSILLAPIIVNGAYHGAVGGILNFDRIKAILEINAFAQDLRYTLLDRNSRVIVSNQEHYKPMTLYVRSGSIRYEKDGISQWTPDLPRHVSTIELWGRSCYISESDIGALSEWKLILEQPVAPFQKKLYENYIGKFSLIFIILLGSLILSEFLSRRILETIDNLRQLTQDLPSKLETNTPVVWPQSIILETECLIGNLKNMADIVSTMFIEVQQINESLEERIKERTEELRKSEEVYRRLFEDHAAVKLIIDPKTGNIFDANASAESFYGWSREELRRMNIRQINILPVEEVSLHMQHAEKQERIRFEFQHRLADGSVRDVEVFSSSVQIKGETYLHSIIHDITERKRSEEENRRLQNQLIQAQKMESVGRLAGGVAHDINNMLNVIMGYSEIALDTIHESDPVATYLQEILTAAQRSTNVVRQLLAFARKQTIAPKPLNFNEAVSGMLKMLQRLIGEDIDLLWKPAEDLWQVKMDPAQLDQILANLIVNARDAIKDVGRITIETQNIRFNEDYCKLHVGFLPGEYVMLAVSDDGVGMDKETQNKIFEPFFTTKEMGKGTGLGLATVYGIVKQNKGFINVYSEIGQGSTFKLYIPRCTSDDSCETKLSETTDSRGEETILLVEDDLAMLTLVKSLLEQLGYKVIAVKTPSEAIRIASDFTGDIHLLMTDVVMPEMNGRELADRLCAIKKEMKVLFMSGYTANVIAHHGVLNQGVHFIQKPFSKKELAIKIRETLNTVAFDYAQAAESKAAES